MLGGGQIRGGVPMSGGGSSSVWDLATDDYDGLPLFSIFSLSSTPLSQFLDSSFSF